MALIIAILTLVVSLTSFGGNTNDFINRERLRYDEITKSVLANKPIFLKLKENSMQQLKNYQPIVETIKNRHQKKPKIGETRGKAIIFVSFSMPDLSLKQIIYDSEHYQVPVVIRGLYKNSFRKTIEKIFELIKETSKGGIAINPRWFKEYDIKVVPAVVVNQEQGTKSDMVYGNIPLKRALEMVAEKGETADTAKKILNIGTKK